VAGGSTFRSLRHRNARLFFVGLIVSNVGTWMQSTALSILVYRLTGRGTDVGITLLCQFLPMLLLGVWAGSVADRVDKRRMALWTQSAMGAQALLLGGLTLAGLTTLPVVYLLSLVLGVLAALDNPARRGLVVELVERDEIMNVLALNTAVMTGSRIFGPALAAVLVDPLGAGWLFIVNGLSFIAIVAPMLAMDVSRLNPSPQAPRGGRPVRESLSFVRHHRTLAVLFVTFTVIGTFAFNYSVSLLKIADARFGDERLFGWLLTASSVGNVIGSLFTAGRGSVGMRYFFSAAVLLGVSGLALAWSPSVWWAYVVALPLGAGGAAMIAALNGITQTESPPDMRGRLLALGAVAFLGTTPIGAPVTGWVADKVSAEWSLAYGSVITLTCVAFAATVHRRETPRTGATTPMAGQDVTVAG
jgi:MFS family permease